MSGDHIHVEVAFATPERQVLVDVELESGADVAAAIRAALPELGLDSADSYTAGVWGEVSDRSRIVVDGDRVELYRPLEKDPREARREIADAER